MKSLNKTKGNHGEQLAKKYLQDLGYNILFSNWTGKWAEIDLIAYLNRTLVFVEVKTRFAKNVGLPEEAISYFKKRKLLNSAKLFLVKYPKFMQDNSCSIRFDVIAVEKGTLRHYENVFSAPGL